MGHRRHEGSVRKLLSESDEHPRNHEGTKELTDASQVAHQSANMLL